MPAIQYIGQTVSGCADVFSKTKENHFHRFIGNADDLLRKFTGAQNTSKEKKPLLDSSSSQASVYVLPKLFSSIL